MNTRKAVILINVGTPDKANVKSIFKYLTAFLNDKRVIDMPPLFRFFLVNFIIIPFRLNKALSRYRMIWTDKGSPLLLNTLKLKGKLQEVLDENIDVYAGMRYGNPSLKTLLKTLEKKNFSKIIFFPLFPQYASATTGTVTEQILREISSWNIIPEIRIISQFYDLPGFSLAFSERIKECKPEKYDHVLFSFHSLPMKHILKTHPFNDIESCNCIVEMPSHGSNCYKAACYETTRNIVAAAGIKSENYTVCFQSRLKGKWLSPSTEEIIIQKATEGYKNILVVSPSFVSDCLETIYDIEFEAAELFQKHGGNKLKLVGSLNDQDIWVNAIKGKVME